MDLSVITVSWNVRERLRECLRSLREQSATTDLRLPTPDFRPQTLEIFLVDNGSADGSAEMAAKEFPEVTLIVNHYNAGFAKANNQAIALAKGEFILLLNPDMRVFQDTLPTMIAFMRSHPEVGVAGCHLLRPKTKSGGQSSVFTEDCPPSSYETVPHARRFPTFWYQAAIVLKIPHLFPRAVSRYEIQDFDYSREAEVDSIRGSFFMIRREVIEQIGALDERFFIWFEEVDFCKRARDAGWKVMYTPAARCVDYVGQSFAQVKRYPKQKMFTKSMLAYFKKHRPWYEWIGLLILRPFGLAAAWVADQGIMRGRASGEKEV